MKLKLTIKGNGRGIPARCYFLGSKIHERETDMGGRLTVDLLAVDMPKAVMIQPGVSGYWGLMELLDEHEGELHADCPPLPPGPKGWWHDIMNLSINPALGAGIRIGVVDTPFKPVGLKEQVQMISPPSSHPSEHDPLAHGAQVCSVLVSQPASRRGFAGICRSATVIHASAIGPDGAARPGVAASAIRALAQDHQADIINLSWGDAQRPSVAVHKAIKDAIEAGAIVLAASGNQGEIRYPAAYDECLAIGAIGKTDFAEAGSHAAFEAFVNRSEIEFDDERFFRCNFSGSGQNISAVAPGCGIIFDINGKGPFDLLGTSFAAPISTATLAIALAADRVYAALPRSEKRSQHARVLFQSLCEDLGLPGNQQGYGLPRLPEFVDRAL